eukprot:CAMPEP_0205908340 /NCGR_PEP_ID=MMETSP1325-20131115/3145_1 /ASSEMBLY_ACC=CAM_ASM_000708 /TAXON_ID=236786 /ORGANISM="Florenciella sp., Strain RCC1007" /LENGTH=194 /DNA_ID=CAMNT_0053274525 /DNA_START=115 /DNA_END=699 /DNA_ORIENTATION=+
MMRVSALFLLLAGASAQSLRGTDRQLLDAAETTALKTMFDLADTNKDGLVSFPELLMMYPAAPAAANAVVAAAAPATAVAAPTTAVAAPTAAAPAAAAAAPAVAAPAATAAAPAAVPAPATTEAAAPAPAATTTEATAKDVFGAGVVTDKEAKAEPEAVKLATEAAAANMAAAIKAGKVEHIEDEEVVGVVNES